MSVMSPNLKMIWDIFKRISFFFKIKCLFMGHLMTKQPKLSVMTCMQCHPLGHIGHVWEDVKVNFKLQVHSQTRDNPRGKSSYIRTELIISGPHCNPLDYSLNHGNILRIS